MKYHLVKYKELIDISEKAYLVVCYNGKKDVVPKSQCVETEKGLYVAEWLLEKKDLQYSTKDIMFLDKEGNFKKPFITRVHIPKEIEDKNTSIDDELIR